MTVYALKPFADEEYEGKELQLELHEVIELTLMELGSDTAVFVSLTMDSIGDTLYDSDGDFDGDLDSPRCFSVIADDTTSDIPITSVVITGLDEYGNVVSETIAINAVQVDGTQVFASVDNIVWPAQDFGTPADLAIYWDIPVIKSPWIEIPDGDAFLQFYCLMYEISGAGPLDFRWYVSWDNGTTRFLLTSEPWEIAAGTVETVAQTTMGTGTGGYGVTWGPGRIVAPMIQMEITARDDVDTADNFVVRAWISRRPIAAEGYGLFKVSTG